MWSATCTTSKMARRKEPYDDDDGRTIADMSEVTRPNLLSFRPFGSREDRRPEEPQQEKADRPWDTSHQMSREERRSYILGAVIASLLIGLAFAVGIGLVILLIGYVHF